jgi:GNAT superfamily N-acetyltransferase
LISRRPATEKDKEFVYGTMKQAYRELVQRVFGDWDEASIRAGFEDDWARGGFEIVSRGDDPVGALWTTDEGDFLRLREIFLLPRYQGGGIGAMLIREEIRRARSAGKPLRLRVVKGNRAIGLYRRLGFVPCGGEGERLWMEIA